MWENDDGRIETLVQEMLRDNKTADALEVVNDYVCKNSCETAGHYWQGVVYLFMKKYRYALNSFEAGAKLNKSDQDILFGLGVTHFALNGYGAGREFIEQFRKLYVIRADESCGRAAMLAAARLYIPAMLFLVVMGEKEYMEDETPLADFTGKLFDEYIEYALLKRPALGSLRLLLDKVDVGDIKALKEYTKRLIMDSCWQDALYFYWKYINKSCCTDCDAHMDKKFCLWCLAEKVFDMPCPDELIFKHLIIGHHMKGGGKSYGLA